MLVFAALVHYPANDAVLGVRARIPDFRIDRDEIKRPRTRKVHTQRRMEETQPNKTPVPTCSKLS